MEWIFQCFVNAGQTTGMNEYNGSKSSGGIEMAMEKGPLSINSENMFPIIKKWLYSDHDIFYRELISNGCDAITKLKKLDMMGDYELPEGFKPRIDIVVDPQEKTIKVTDNGLGMTAAEVKEYINNIAFSGAEAFLEKYKDKASDDQIIGHFGLGFYSSFMVAELVEIDTLSYQDGAKAVHWECDGGSTFAMDDGSYDKVGTTVTLHLSEDCVEFANYYRAQEVVEKYCSFMPVEIYLSENNTKMTEIIDELTAQGIRSVRDNRLSINSLRYILHNDRYLGTYRYADVVIEDGMPQLVDQETFDKVQRRFKENRSDSGRFWQACSSVPP